MKKILLFLIIFLSFEFSYSQIGGTPASGVEAIPRTGNSNVNKAQSVAKNNTPIPSPGTPTGNSEEVGVTKGEFEVSLTGAATYNIPIAVPPGINGVEPEISLSYNSQDGNGLAGYGWNISGVSIISKIPSTKYHDNSIDPVDFDTKDRYAIDGQRLVVKSGTSGVYGADGTEYETESYSNLKITSYGVHPEGSQYGPEYFLVQHPDGSVSYYGNSTNSRSKTDWAVTYWQNPQGLRISYTYTLSNNNLSISSIKYGSRLTAPAINEISFIYKTRQRAEQAFISGQSFVRNTILSRIAVRGNNVGYRNYVLGHEPTSLGYERLISVTEKSGDNVKSLNPTVFTYENSDYTDFFDISSPIPLNLSNIDFTNTRNVTGDFNGDGKMDFIVYPTNGADAKKKYYLFTDLQGTSVNIGAAHNVGAFVDIIPTSWLNHMDKIMPMQGWCVIQNTPGSSVTTFKNYSAGTVAPIYTQYEKTYDFPKITYYNDCPGLVPCGVTPGGGGLDPGFTDPGGLDDGIAKRGGRDLDPGLDPVDPWDPGLGPGPGPGPILTPNCATVTNLDLNVYLNGEAILTWDTIGSPTATSWEVYYFEDNSGSAPGNNTPVGTYTIVTQNSFTLSNFNRRKNYTFYVRAICNNSTGVIANNWVGPYNYGLIVTDPPVPSYKVVPKEYISGDFNGDGLTDIIAIDKTVSYSTRICQGDCYTTSYVTVQGGKTYFVNLDRRLTTNFVNMSGNITTTNNSEFGVADVNGDGKSDLLVFDSGSVRVYTLNDNKHLVQLLSKYDSAIKSDKPRYVGDFNGDGKMDFVIPQEAGTDSWSFFFSKDNDFNKVTTSIGFNFVESTFGYAGVVGWPVTTRSLIETSFVANDINGDGKTDLIVQQNFTVECYMTSRGCGYDDTQGDPQVTRFWVLENMGSDGNSISFNQTYVNAQLGGIKRYPIPLFLDHNNFNQNLEYALMSDNKVVTFKASKDHKKDVRLKEITLGSGVREIISYSPLNNNCGTPYCNMSFNPSSYTETYPNFDIVVANSLQVVSKVEQVSAGQYKQQKFGYYGAVTNVEGRGFLGFRALSKTNWFNSDFDAITSVTYNDINKRGATTETFTVLGEMYVSNSVYSPNVFISKSLLTYNEELLPNKVYKISNASNITYNGLENTSVETTYTYDGYNNPLTSTMLHKKAGTTEKNEFVQLEYFNQPTGSNYYIGRVKQRNSTITHNGNTTTGEEKYTYTGSLVTKIQKKGHLTNYLTEDNVYDVFGNITKKTITAIGLTPRVNNFAYDASGRFLISSTDAEGLVTSYTYSNNTGLLASQTLPSNSGYPLTTSFVYDAWGRKKTETNYLGKNTNYSYMWLSPGNAGFYSVSITGDDNSANFNWYDDLGRKISEGYRTLNDGPASEPKNSFKTFTYDIYDRVTKAYEPHLAMLPSTNGSFNETKFDVYGRPLQIIEHTGKTTNFSYNGLTTTADDGITTKITTKNSFGKVVSHSDNGGTITYQYFADGNLKQSNFGGVIIKFEYDGWGRKTKLTDPSAGVYTYEYNDFGEMIKETTPKGITNYTLDNFGKLLEKTTVGSGGDPTNTKTTYTYDAASKLVTYVKFTDITGGFYTEYNYGYDDYRRLYFTDENGFNAYYQRATLFDDFGRPEKQLFAATNTSDSKSSIKWIKNTYKNGHHWQILDFDTNELLWQATKVNGRGQLTQGSYGNGININNTYDDYGFPTEFKYTNSAVSPAADVLTLNNTFNAERGNLTGRYSSITGYQENFTYDDVDRLSGWSNDNQLHNFTFTTNTESFTPTSGSASVSLNTTLLRLNVSAFANFQGTQRVVYQNAPVGKQLKFKGTIYFKNLVVGNHVRFSVVERDPVTGQSNETIYGVNSSSVHNFSFEHTVTQYPEVYIKIVAGNNLSWSSGVTFAVDNITVAEVINNNQTYDSLGRINENEVGAYKYTLTNPATSMPKHFQNSAIDVNPDYTSYYQSRGTLNITYNAFKSPIEIFESGKDRLSFRYNVNNGRSTMYYGGLQSDQLLRPLRKHYSADGTIEIKQNLVTDEVEFITYIGGDAYSAPLVLRSDGIDSEYLYLHRDYLGSILAISDQQGNVIEKRHFDAWGNIKLVQNHAGNNIASLTVLDRGYTGHEHLQKVALIHMNARLYDPVVHRFLQPDNFVQDPFNTQNFNRYSYVMNNPLKYTDASGEFWFVVVGAIVGAYLGASLQQGTFNPAKWDNNWWKGAVVGGVIGAYGAQLLVAKFSTSLIATGGISKHTVFAKALMASAKGMIKTYASSIFSFSMENGFKLSLGLNDAMINKMLVSGIIAGAHNMIGQGLDLIYKAGKEGGEAASGLLASKEWAGKLSRNLLDNTLKGISTNIIKGNKGVFEDLTYLSFGNGLIELAEGKKIINFDKITKHAQGWGMYGLAAAFGHDTAPKFDEFGLSFDYKSSTKYLGKFFGDWWKGLSLEEKIVQGATVGTMAGIVSTLGLSIRFD
jgi:RHS repeat-associated protein